MPDASYLGLLFTYPHEGKVDRAVDRHAGHDRIRIRCIAVTDVSGELALALDCAASLPRPFLVIRPAVAPSVSGCVVLEGQIFPPLAGKPINAGGDIA